MAAKEQSAYMYDVCIAHIHEVVIQCKCPNHWGTAKHTLNKFKKCIVFSYYKYVCPS